MLLFIKTMNNGSNYIILVPFATLFKTINQASTDKERNTLIRFLDDEGN